MGGWPPRALYSSPGLRSGFVSTNGAKLCDSGPLQTMLFSVDPSNGNRPSDGFSQCMPSAALRVAGRLVRVVVAPVVHAVQVAVLEHGEIGGGRIFPGFFEPQDDLGLSWTVQHQRGAGCDVHEPVVDEELAFGADLDRDRRRSGRRRRRRLIGRLRHRRFGCRLGRRDGRGGRAGGQQAGRQRLGAAGRRGGCRNEQRRADQGGQPP